MSNIQKLKEIPVDKLLQELRTREVKTLKSGVINQPKALGEVVRPEAIESEPSKELQEYDDKSLIGVVKEKQKAVYGVDDRIEVCALPENSQEYKDADSVVALFRAWKVIDNGDGTSSLLTNNFGEDFNLCVGERFRDQPIGTFCSGFLVAPDIIATAGHCVNADNLTDIRFIFGFRMNKSGTVETVINNKEIYRGVELIGRQQVGDGPDWSLVRIDRSVTNHHIASIRRDGKVSDQQTLHVIGHPCGLPAKFAGGAKVRSNLLDGFFVANLDTYGGNSGSPVFNSEHMVEGILVRGETDFVLQSTCNVSLVCPDTGCRGEDCTRTTKFQQLVPQQKMRKQPAQS